MILGVLPAVGSGLDTMARAGQLGRLMAYVNHWRGPFEEIRYFSYLSTDVEVQHIRSADALDWCSNDCGPERHGQIGEVLCDPATAMWTRAVRRPLGRERWAWRDLSAIRCTSLVAAIPALTANAIWRTPFVVSLGADYETIARIHGHGRQAWKWRALRAVVMRRAAAVIVPNPVHAARMQARYPRTRIVNIPNWVDTERFCPAGKHGAAHTSQTHAEIGSAGTGNTVGPFFLLYVGRLVAEKNLPRFAEAIRDLRVAGRSVELLCVGDGPEREQLRRLGAVILGSVPWTELPTHVYPSADVFVLPSLSEGHPKSLLEAMSCGLACLVSDRIEGVIRHGETGLVFGAEDQASMRRVVNTALSEPALRASLGKAARAEVEAKYRKDVLLRRECALLKEIARCE